jgi:Protein of unknown function (DUF1573)
MKNIALIYCLGFLILMTVASCKKEYTVITNENTTASTTQPEISTTTTDLPIMEFENREHNFGLINEGAKVYYVFNFRNSGKSDLIISNAIGSCGCTIPEYPKQPIKVGESGKIKVSFNAAGKSGNQQKTVTITTNTSAGKELLTIRAIVKTK